MIPMRKRLGIVHGAALGLLVLGAAALPARADWLVTREGGRVETKGPWQVKGKLVVFTRAADSGLASLRLADVDLDASSKVTAEAKVQAAAPPPPPEPPKKKLAVLTDKDFKKPTPPDEASKAGDDKPVASNGPVAVASWKRTDGDNGVTIEGTLNNTTGSMIVNASVEVELYNEAGDKLGTAEALLTSTSVQPNGAVTFRANFPGVFAFSDARFKPNGMPLDMTPPGEKKDDGAPPS
jgi:hypothetical protein